MNGNARDFTGQTVVDIDGTKVGDVVDFYFDAGTNEAEWLVVEGGLLGQRQALVPVDGTRREGDELVTPYPKDLILDAPSIEAASLDLEAEQALYQHYHMRRELPGRVESRAAFEQDTSPIDNFRLRSWKQTSAA